MDDLTFLKARADRLAMQNERYKEALRKIGDPLSVELPKEAQSTIGLARALEVISAMQAVARETLREG